MKLQYIFIACAFIALTIACRTSEKEAPKVTIQAPTSHSWNYDASERYPIISAHRGGKEIPGYPENHLETMKYLHSKYPMMTYEVDINASSDGQLYLFHDDVLDHKTTGNGSVKDRTWQELSTLKLKENNGNVTDYHFSPIEEVLEWADENDVVLWVDFKRSVRYEDVISLIKKYDAPDNVILISYSMGQARKLHNLAPNMFLSVSARNKAEWDRVVASGISLDRVIAFTGTILSDKTLFANIHKAGVKTSLGSLGNLDRKAKSQGDHLYREWFDMGIDMFSTDRPEAVAKALGK